MRGLQEQPGREIGGREEQKEEDKAVAVPIHELHPLAGTVKKAVKRAVAHAGDEVLHDKLVKATVKKIVKNAVKQAVEEATHDADIE